MLRSLLVTVHISVPMAPISTLVIVLSGLSIGVTGNFTCVCNLNTQAFQVFDSINAGAVIGYLNPNECIYLTSKIDTNQGWFVIKFNNSTGYVIQDDTVVMANCSSTITGSSLGTSFNISSVTVPSVDASTTAAPASTNTISPALMGNLTLCPAYVVHGAKASGCVVTQHKHQCYEVCHTWISWSHANQLCTERGGHLLSVHNDMENNYVHHVLQQLNYTHRVWMGLHDRDNESHFVWTTGEKFSFKNWAYGEPAQSHKNMQDCVVMMTSGFWDDVHCGGDDMNSEATLAKNPYICEYRIHNDGSYIIG